MRKKGITIRSLEMALGTQVILTTDFSTVKAEGKKKKKKWDHFQNDIHSSLK